ncbi:MAG TPA: hypothetical protein VHS28_11410 [Chloroflexota bacterium]|nr:hypothetical protein [Chloroflexota bacterium]
MKRIALLVAAFALAASAAAIPAVGEESMDKSPQVVEAVLNGLKVTIDADTGSILRLYYPGPETMLESTPERASIIDLAYPVAQFEPFRLASRYSHGAHVTKTDDAVVIYWSKLGPNRDCFPVEGNVSATVRMQAAPDGRSVIMTAEVNNGSKNAVRQVVFPDFSGMLPFCGMDKTMFRGGSFGSLPFLELQPNEDRRSIQYMIDTACYSNEYKAGGMFSGMWIRWTDFGGLKGGMSLFPKRWGWDPQVTERLHLSEVENKMRWLCLNDVTLKPGEKWQSCEFWLTPHKQGWAKGIEPYRAWAKQNIKRDYPVPKHVREGIGYRTAWMCQNQPNDPKDAIFTMKDLPKLAEECKENGIDEMVLWAWNKGFILPLPGPYPHLGTEKDMVQAVKECKRLGVNVVPFISVIQANPESAPRYNLKVTDNNGWTYHTEMVPRWNPPYATGFSCVQVGPLNKLWHEDVLAGCKHLVDLGVNSLSWDQFWTTNDPEPNMLSLAKQIRDYAKKRDPESTFSGEELWNIELDSGYLDYTWNWGGYKDCRAFTSVFPAPRINCCISSSSLYVKKSFADSLYMNIFPRKAESINGSDYISNYPEMSLALKQCAKLKKQFLPYFVDGTLIGECLLSDTCPAAHICAYTLGDKAIMVLINQGAPQNVAFDVDLEPWVKSASGSYQVKLYDQDGKLLRTVDSAPAKWHGETGQLKTEEMMIVEFVGK